MEKKETWSSWESKISTVFTPEKFNAWNNLVNKFDDREEIDFTISIADVKKLKKDSQKRKFVLEPLYEEEPYHHQRGFGYQKTTF